MRAPFACLLPRGRAGIGPLIFSFVTMVFRSEIGISLSSNVLCRSIAKGEFFGCNYRSSSAHGWADFTERFFLGSKQYLFL